jgi:uncharacterized protein with ParB-like and HNH nuclease domain
METKKINIQKIFSTGKFLVPIYQRNYAWGEKEITTLLDDIKDIDENSDEYFLGSVVFFDRGNNEFEVIDGQQRLTTLYLLFTYLNTTFNETITLPQDCLVYSSRPGYKNALESLNNEKQRQGDEGSQSLIDGYRYIQDAFGSGMKDMSREDFIRKMDKVVLFMIEVPRDTDLNRYFEIMNTRGEQLEQHEVLKNRMYSKLHTDKEKALFAKIWDSCSNMGKYIQKAFTLNDTDKRTKIFGESWDSFTRKDFPELLSFFEDNKLSIDADEISIFDSINEEDIENVNKIDDEESIDDFQPLITFPALLLHCKNIVDGGVKNLDDGKLLDYFSECELNEEFIKNYAYILLKAKFFLDNYIIHRETDAQAEDEFVLKRGHKTGDNNLTPKNAFSFEKEEDVIDDDEKTKAVIMIQSCLRVSFSSPKQMYWITKLLVALITNNAADNIIQTCESYLKDEVRKYIKDENFVSAYQNLPRYVYFYLDYLLWRDGYEYDEIKIDDKYKRDFKFLFRSPIDHFIPLEKGESYSFDETPKESQWKHSFGNLSCITTNLNFRIKSDRDINLTYDQLLQSPKLYIMAKIKEKHRKYDENVAAEHCKKMKEILKY